MVEQVFIHSGDLRVHTLVLGMTAATVRGGPQSVESCARFQILLDLRMTVDAQRVLLVSAEIAVARVARARQRLVRSAECARRQQQRS